MECEFIKDKLVDIFVCQNCDYGDEYEKGVVECDLWVNEKDEHLVTCGVNWCPCIMLFVDRYQQLKVYRLKGNKWYRKLLMYYYDEGFDIKGYKEGELFIDPEVMKLSKVDYVDKYSVQKEGDRLFSGFVSFFMYFTRGVYVEQSQMEVKKLGYDGVDMTEYNRFLDRERRRSRRKSKYDGKVF